ncbi:hypothetical protein [Bacillus sp. V5-8f]|uniref:hypothetical protein n=1 Tax=Bacillus sp. V5-8f TaxID=2053044 RepID=UPI000C76CB64|nr:hypothetical protein [Bacillus sp. V5-8f]PLT34657.1 hypothetical protein CUU64_04410 [Bacillus sp. V5-8f]
MEFLFELLLNNLPFIIIVVGVIYSFIGKRRSSAQQEQKKRKTVPEIFKEAWDEQNNEARTLPRQQKTIQPDTENHPVAPDIAASQLEGKLNQARKDLALVLSADGKETRAPGERIAEHNEYEAHRPDLHFDRQKLIDGIIMAEVLGPPKSRQKRR